MVCGWPVQRVASITTAPIVIQQRGLGDLLALLLGAVILCTVVLDILWTTLWTDGGAGPLSARVTTGLWRGLRLLDRDTGRVLTLAGPVILTVTLFVWVGLIWAGWTVVFAGGDPSLINTRTSEPVGWVEWFYFVGYTMFTMGNGDFYPASDGWEIAAGLSSFTGILFVTLGVSYVLSVLGSVVKKRSFASTVMGLGSRSEAFVRTGWNGEEFHEFNRLFQTLGAELGELAQQHQAYPVLHYYHSQHPEDSSAMAVAVFDEALTTLRFGVDSEVQPDDVLVTASRASVESYIRTRSSVYIQPAADAPPPPELHRIPSDVPTVDPDAFADALEELEARRRTLHGIVEADAGHWPPVSEQPGEADG